jgi:flavin reductase (DIM6/NTAB) family NADH-FMN oxidoreductase RutF
MMPDFREISPETITDNTFKLIDKDWMLITAGTLENWNTMTASWGGFGILWSRPVTFCFVRPTRHTYGYMERADRYTLSFFGAEWRDALTLCGTKSGRDTDKAAATGLKPVSGSTGAVWFEQARMVLECRKLYFTDIDPRNFQLPAIEDNYPKKDYHRLYVGEVERCLAR